MSDPVAETRPEPTGWPGDATNDAFVGDWRIWQRRGGHRSSTDDILTAWLAVWGTERFVSRYLDLGCGVGSVLLLTAHALRPSHSVGIEAQAQSVALLERTIGQLPEPPPLRAIHGDLRSMTAERLGGPFELITGSPPYLPLGTGVLPDDAQRAACRFELRGGIEEYCEAAARLLHPSGRFCTVFQTEWATRVMDAADAANLIVARRFDVLTHIDRDGPFLSVFELRRRWERPRADAVLAVRDKGGALHPTYRAVRRMLSLPVHDRS